MTHNIAYDRGNMFYCINCGLWSKIILEEKHAGIPGFIVAGNEKNVYVEKINKYPCMPGDEDYVNKIRTKCLEVL